MTENRLAEPVRQDTLSSHSPDASQQPTADPSLPPAHPHLKTHVGDSASDHVQFLRQICSESCMGPGAVPVRGCSRVQILCGDLSDRHTVTPLGPLSAGRRARPPPAAAPSASGLGHLASF